MSYVTVEVSIQHGHIVAKEPDQLPENATGLLTILPTKYGDCRTSPARKKAELPLIHGDGKRIINPTPQDLDVSLWGD
jgi:hypothetical protein